MIKTCLLVGVIIALQVPLARADEPVSLRPQWTVGQSALYEFWSRREQKTTMSLGTNTREVVMMITTEGRTRWSVDRVNADGSAEATMILEWISAQIESNGQTQTNDSRRGSGDNEAMHKLLTAMAGVPLTVAIKADGSIDSVTGIDAMKGRIGSELEQLVPKPLDFVETASEMVSISAAPASALPGDSFRADYRWTHELGHTDQAWTYRIESVENLEGVDVAIVAGSGSIRLDVDRSQIPAEAPPTDIRMTTGRGTSQVFFDLHRRETIGRHATQDTTVEVNITLPNNRGVLRRSIEQTIQSQLLRLEEN